MNRLINAGRHLVSVKMLWLKHQSLNTSEDFGTFVTYEGPILTWRKGEKPRWSGRNLHLLDKSRQKKQREDQKRRRFFYTAKPGIPKVLVVVALQNQRRKVMRDLQKRGVDPVFIGYGHDWLSAFDFEKNESCESDKAVWAGAEQKEGN
jgi:hypothetical protein